MGDWLLTVAIAGVASFSDIKALPMPEAQCRAALAFLAQGRGIGVACVGPNGETVEPKR
jgi:hypothetical protein